MTPEDRDRLRRLAHVLAKPMAVLVEVGDLTASVPLLSTNVALGNAEWDWRGYVPALDAIALWSLLGEPTCLLCGEKRADLGGVPSYKSPDQGSVLCSACRSYPNQRRNYIDGTLETFSVWKCDPTGRRG